MQVIIKPNFFVIGAPKCGTTALTSYLENHPNIYMCVPKEPHYFSTDISWQIVDKIEKYLSLFSGVRKKHSAIGEGSVFYLYSKCAIENIINFNPNSKFIVMLRNPLELVESLYAENRKSGSEEFDNFETAWRAQGLRKNNPKNRNPNALQYEAIAKLGEQLDRLYSIVNKNQVHVILFDDFVINTRLCYLKTLEFLAVDDDHRTKFPMINKKHTYRSVFANKIITSVSDFVGFSPLVRRPLKIVSDAIRIINYSSSPHPPLRPEFKQELISVFHDDVLLLSRLLNRDLSSWLK